MAEDDIPPEWVGKLMEIIGKNMRAEDPMHCRVWMHDDEPVWHFEVGPSLFDDGGDVILREYNVHLTPILSVLETTDVCADPDGISVTGTFEGHAVHVVIWTQPEEEDEDVFAEPKKVSDTPLPN